MIRTIYDRRSIRKFKTDPVPGHLVEEIIRAGMAAPSAKNRQPWRFIVTAGNAKAEVLDAMERGLRRESREPLLPGSAHLLWGAENTLRIMRQAPTLIFVENPFGIDLYRAVTPEERIFELCNAQSAGAMMENMSLTAVEAGLGSLWICDIFFAYRELKESLRTEGELHAAFAVGYPEEAPPARPRKAFGDIVDRRE